MTTRVTIHNHGPADVLVNGRVVKPGDENEQHVYDVQHVVVVEAPKPSAKALEQELDDEIPMPLWLQQ